MKLLLIILAIVTCLQLANCCCCGCFTKCELVGKPTISKREVKPSELDLFYTFDTDKDGLINIEEARASLNVTLDAFNEVDTNRDGFIQPAEFDSSLDNYPYANDEENENENTEMIKRMFTMMEKFTERMESYESQL
eukprot:GFUD01101333.1.p1 GENE.GFUD01101333.1~~GFUD01101333.1.p1  ORF type:complete len:137 (+),score=44.97 GFUD01101333.1:15-425(+)